MNEKMLNQYLEGFSCSGCKHFLDSKCNHKNHDKHNKSKAKLIDIQKNIDTEFSKDWIKNIDKHYVCLNDYEPKIKSHEH